MAPVVALIYVLLSAVVFFIQWKRRRAEHSRRLPPGSMGWPYIGETLKLYNQHPNTFFSVRRKMYGSIFKSHILGYPCVMISSPEAVRMVLVSHAHLFRPTYPASKMKMIGPQALFFHQGDYHSAVKKLVQASFLPSAIKGSVAGIEDIVRTLLPKWEKFRTPVCTLKQMKQYAFEVAIISAFGNNPESETEGIKCLYHTLEKGYNSMPIDIPGTPFYQAMKARRSLNERLIKLIEKRRQKGDAGGGLLGNLLRSQSSSHHAHGKSHKLSASQIADNIIGVIFAAHDTTATALTWLLRYLHDNPTVLQAVTREQEEIRQKMEEEGRWGLRWEDRRGMTVTTRVIQETLRSASILSFTFREAVEDVELGGYFIPKGWKILPLFRTIHHSPDFFPHPHKFDPTRFEVAPRPNTYMPFGNGVHSCPGNHLALLEILILLHHLTLTYRWKVVGEEDSIEYCPFPVPKGGLPVHVYLRNNKK